jgi:type IV secretory pathway TraG/TraD family ATPase VirD4
VKLRDEMETWESSTILMLVGMIVVAVAAAVLDVGVHAWAWATGAGAMSWNPFELAAGLATGEIDTASGVRTWIAGTAVVMALLVVAAAAAAGRKRGRRKRGDDMADLAGAGRDIEALSPRAAREKAQRLRVRSDAFGLPVGRSVKSGRELFSDFEAVCTLIAGPRTGKTTSWAVPRIYAAPGVVMATSNKRDILDITRDRRLSAGRVWVFDPQQIASEPQAWWWDPLAFATDSEKAARLTEAFFGASTGNATGKKDVWEEWACQLIAGMILAAAREHLPLMTLHRWINDQTDREPVKILRRHGEETTAISLEGRMNLVPETRSGVYGGAAHSGPARVPPRGVRPQRGRHPVRPVPGGQRERRRDRHGDDGGGHGRGRDARQRAGRADAHPDAHRAR